MEFFVRRYKADLFFSRLVFGLRRTCLNLPNGGTSENMWCTSVVVRVNEKAHPIVWKLYNDLL